VLFFQGAGGDINPAACSWDDPERPTRAAGEMRRLGRIVADGLDALVAGVEPAPASGVASRDLHVAVPTAEPRRELLESALREARSAAADSSAGGEPAELAAARTRWAEELLALLAENRYPAAVAVPVQILRIGEAFFVGIAAELFSWVGLEIKRGMGRERTFVSAYTNGCVGYIASERSYDTSEYGVYKSAALYGIPVLAREAGTVLANEVLEAAAELR